MLERKTEQTAVMKLKGDLTNLAFITFKSQSNLHNFLLTGSLSPREAALERTAVLRWAELRWIVQPNSHWGHSGAKRKHLSHSGKLFLFSLPKCHSALIELLPQLHGSQSQVHQLLFTARPAFSTSASFVCEGVVILVGFWASYQLSPLFFVTKNPKHQFPRTESGDWAFQDGRKDSQWLLLSGKLTLTDWNKSLSGGCVLNVIQPLCNPENSIEMKNLFSKETWPRCSAATCQTFLKLTLVKHKYMK